MWDSVEVDVGVGMGYGLNVDVCGFGAQAVWKEDVLSFSVNNGKLDFGARKETNAGVGGPYYPLVGKDNKQEFNSYITDELGDFHEIDDSDDYVVGFQLQGYFMYGFTIKAGINLEELYYGLKESFTW